MKDPMDEQRVSREDVEAALNKGGGYGVVSPDGLWMINRDAVLDYLFPPEDRELERWQSPGNGMA